MRRPTAGPECAAERIEPHGSGCNRPGPFDAGGSAPRRRGGRSTCCAICCQALQTRSESDFHPPGSSAWSNRKPFPVYCRLRRQPPRARIAPTLGIHIHRQQRAGRPDPRSGRRAVSRSGQRRGRALDPLPRNGRSEPVQELRGRVSLVVIERPSIVVAVAGKREQSLRFDPFSAGRHYSILPFWLSTSRLRSNFLAADLPGMEDRDQQLRYPGNVG
jgi:hypothetical protein